MTRLILLLSAVLLPGSAYGQGADWPGPDNRDGVHLRILGDYELPAGAIAHEPIVVIAGSATIDGTAEDDVVVIGGTLRAGSTAVINGDVTVVGGETIIDPAARVAGTVDRTVVVGPDIDFTFPGVGGVWWAAFAFGATLLRFAIVLIIAMLLTLVAPDWIRGIGGRLAASPMAAAGIGVATQVLFVPALIAVAVALIISIVGILLLVAFPFVLGGAALLWVAGFTAVAMSIGARLRGVPAANAGLADVIIGFALIWMLTLAAQALAVTTGELGVVGWTMRAAGWVIEWMAWTVGLGAAVALLLGGRQVMSPPPIPFVVEPRPTA